MWKVRHCCVVGLQLFEQLGPSYVTGRALSSSNRSFGCGQARSEENVRCVPTHTQESQDISKDDLLAGVWPVQPIIGSTSGAVIKLYQWQRAERSKKMSSGGGSPRKYDDLLTGPSDLDVQSSQWWSFTSKNWKRTERIFTIAGIDAVIPDNTPRHFESKKFVHIYSQPIWCSYKQVHEIVISEDSSEQYSKCNTKSLAIPKLR